MFVEARGYFVTMLSVFLNQHRANNKTVALSTKGQARAAEKEGTSTAILPLHLRKHSVPTPYTAT